MAMAFCVYKRKYGFEELLFVEDRCKKDRFLREMLCFSYFNDAWKNILAKLFSFVTASSKQSKNWTESWERNIFH